MTETLHGSDRLTEPAEVEPRRPRHPLVLVVTTLIALVIFPLVVQRRTETTRQFVRGVAEPARALATEVQLALALEIAGVRGYLITGEAQYADVYRQALAQRDSAYRQLLPLAERLGPEVHAEVTALGDRLRSTDRVLEDLFSGQVAEERYIAELDLQQGRFEAIVNNAARVDDAIGRVTAERRNEIEDTYRYALIAIIGLAVLALIAALMVARLGTEYHTLALRLQERSREQVALLDALAASEERFRQIADHLEEVIWLGDPQLEHAYYVNPAYEKVWGRSPESFHANPRSAIELVHPDDREHVESTLLGLPKGEFDLEYRIVRGDGEVRWVSSRAYPIHDSQGRLYRVAGIMEDITEQKDAEAERESLLAAERRARAESEAARAEADRRAEDLRRVTESRARLMRGFTHDVKNPLGAADGYLQLLEDGIFEEVTPKQKEIVQTVRRTLGTALGLIDDLLEFARAESGHIQLQCEPTDLRAVLDEVVEGFRGDASAKGLALEVHPTAEIPEVRTDAKRVTQITGNLLSNAVKYTDSGKITVLVDDRHETAGPREGRWITIAVSDTGPGISAEDQATLFQEFHRLDGSDGKRGAGIGLAISQRIAQALGGEITVESEPGRGSTFTLWLPAGSPAGVSSRVD